MSCAIDLDAIEARATAATPGPWRPGFWSDTTGGFFLEAEYNYGLLIEQADEAFIVAARQDVPALIARIRELEQIVAGLEGALLEERMGADL